MTKSDRPPSLTPRSVRRRTRRQYALAGVQVVLSVVIGVVLYVF